MHEARSYKIAITAEDGTAPATRSVIRSAIRAALRHHQVKKAQVSVALVGDTLMARLNRRHLAHRGSTDVLSFDLSNGRPSPDAVDGELIVCVDAAKREAKLRGHAARVELALYAVHGVLHLLGYDDAVRRSALRMRRVEREILSRIGIQVHQEITGRG